MLERKRERRTIVHVVARCCCFVATTLVLESAITDQPYTAHWFSPRAHHARVSQCRNRDVSPPYRSTYNANILSFLLPVEQPILFVRFERDDELYRRRKRKRREEICQLDGDLFVSKISTRIVIVSYYIVMHGIFKGGGAMVGDESDEYFKSKLRISIKLGKKKFTTLLKRR